MLTQEQIEKLRSVTCGNTTIICSVVDELVSRGAASTTLRDVAKAFSEVGFRVIREGHSWNIIIT